MKVMPREKSNLTLPIVVVFKSPTKKDIKIKVYKNTTIDEVNFKNKLPGIPQKSEILELGIGNSFVKRYKEKYNIV